MAAKSDRGVLELRRDLVEATGLSITPKSLHAPHPSLSGSTERMRGPDALPADPGRAQGARCAWYSACSPRCDADRKSNVYRLRRAKAGMSQKEIRIAFHCLR